MKNLPRRDFLRVAGLAAAGSILCHPALAQAYPSRPVRLVIPFNAGGSTDIVGRLMCQWLSERTGQSFVVENKPGGGTNIATQLVVNAPPDGYTLLYTVSTHSINPSLYKSLPFDFQRDIVAVAGLFELPLVLVMHPQVPAKNFAEFIAYAKANPGKINMGSFGVRTISHLSIELLKSSTGIEFQHVPYTGGAPMLAAMIPGQIEAGVDALPNALPHIRSGALRALAVLSRARTPTLPDVPTMSELTPGYEVTSWNGVGAPRGTPPEIVERLNREINAGLRDAALLKRAADIGGIPIRATPAEMTELIARATDKWAKVVKAAGIEPQ
ncbi:MAG: tripartite tricarboxylate transporter substrate binding protein [Xanthobacteraceae bacterium]|nr:tripartite tricarboxylate transporter substrate binding protein [Xanthobacteraceae bacterium]